MNKKTMVDNIMNMVVNTLNLDRSKEMELVRLRDSVTVSLQLDLDSILFDLLLIANTDKTGNLARTILGYFENLKTVQDTETE